MGNNLEPFQKTQTHLKVKNRVENGSKWFPMAKKTGLEAKIKSLEDSEQNLQFHSLKWSLASYSPSTLFLTFRWVWDFWK